MPTTRTLATGIARVYQDQRHTTPTRFIADKHSQLLKRPTVQLTTLLARNRYSVTNTAQIFKGDSTQSAFRNQHNLFADTVMDGYAPKRLGLPRLLTDKIASRVGTFKRLIKHLPLFGCRQEFDYRCQFHNCIAHIYLKFNIVKGKIGIPLLPKNNSFPPSML
jgi:hypothetical protein